ncbi:hypothetical protein Pmi06nite_21290 [Planotetraspora mira]|uniref:DUF3566 domain-containing protein n=1 Tax=Planotetraspora mira TaxID=58121 RepID=A0A8J3X5F7_9ACTN|nr:hypothetical protein Pmi06nite_21290 [Planotetraspora mira]
MSDSGGARATGAARKKSPGARPASSSMRDGVTERVDKDDNVVEVASEKEDATPAGKPESDSDNATVRIRTSAADQPWKSQSSKDGEKPADRQSGPETAPFAKPAVATPSAAAPADRSGKAGGPTGAKPAVNESAASGPGSGSGFGKSGSGAGKPKPGGDKPFGGDKPIGGGKPDVNTGPRGGARGPVTSGSATPPGSESAGPTATFPRPTYSSGDGSRPGTSPVTGASSPAPPVSASPIVPSPVTPAQDAPARGSAFGLAERPEATSGTAKGKAKKADAKGPRKAHLVLRRIEPWSAMKFSFVISIVCFVILFVAVAILYGVLSGIGVFSSITDAVTQLTTGDSKTASTLDISSWFAPGRILGYAGLLGAINVVLITALCTLGAVIYNVCAEFVGGVEVTFSEAE